jgi:hypothetical protein
MERCCNVSAVCWRCFTDARALVKLAEQAAAVEGGGGIRKEGDDDGLSQEVWSRSLRDPMDFPRSSSRRLARAMMVELL